MPILDMTLANPRIAAFFSHATDEPPTAELLYAHTHMVEDNFLSQIEVFILLADQALTENPRKKGVAQRLVDLSEQLAQALGEITEESAVRILFLLRDILDVCMKVVK